MKIPAVPHHPLCFGSSLKLRVWSTAGSPPRTLEPQEPQPPENVGAISTNRSTTCPSSPAEASPRPDKGCDFCYVQDIKLCPIHCKYSTCGIYSFDDKFRSRIGHLSIPIKKINGLQPKKLEMKKGRTPKFRGESLHP